MNSLDPPIRTKALSLEAVAMLAVVGTLLLMALGSMVNSLQATSSVPDWPLSYGKWTIVGVWAGNAVIEHSHRLAAVGVGAVLLALVTLGSFPDRSSNSRRSLMLAGGLFIGQVLFGGAVVLLHAPAWMTATHALTAQIVFVVLCLSVFPPRPHIEADDRMPLEKRQRRLVLLTALAVSLQVALGVLARHPELRMQLIVAFLGHLVGGLLLLVLLPLATISVARRSGSRVRRAALTLLVLFLAQLLVAVPLFVVAPEPLDEPWPPEPWFPTLHAAHVTLAASLLATSWWLALSIRPSRA